MYIHKCDIIPYDIGSEQLVAITGKCIFSDKLCSVIITKNELERIDRGEMIQDVLPHIHKADREFLISGVSPESFEDLYPSIKDPSNNLSIKDLLKRKKDWQSFEQILDRFGIIKLFHFTDESNIESIQQSNGLVSSYCSRKYGIKVNKYSSDEISRVVDISKGLENFVRLSFLKEHPMLYVALKSGRIEKPFIIEVSRAVIFLQYTMFSVENAAKSGVVIDDSIENFSSIRFSVMKQNYLSVKESLKKFMQAEVLVRQNIPFSYIDAIYAM